MWTAASWSLPDGPDPLHNDSMLEDRKQQYSVSNQTCVQQNVLSSVVIVLITEQSRLSEFSYKTQVCDWRPSSDWPTV